MKDNCRSFVAALLWMTSRFVGGGQENADPGCDEGQLQIPIRLRSGQAFVVRRGGLLWMTSGFA